MMNRSYAKLISELRESGNEIYDPDEVEREIAERIEAGTITVNQVRELRGLDSIQDGNVTASSFCADTL